jgi:transcriptional regulator with XRE-family HTH domain
MYFDRKNFDFKNLLFLIERERKNIRLQDVEKAIKIRTKYLEQIENNNWSSFSSKIYIIGIINNYAKYLNLDKKKLVAFFRREYERKEEIKFKKKIASHYLNPETKKYGFLGIMVLFLVFFVYFGIQIKAYLSPPSVAIVSPRDQTFYNLDKIKIVGKTEKEATVTVMGERVFLNKDGVFEYDLPLKQGKNEFVADVVGGNGKKTVFKKVFIRGVGIF